MTIQERLEAAEREYNALAVAVFGSDAWRRLLFLEGQLNGLRQAIEAMQEAEANAPITNGQESKEPAPSKASKGTPGLQPKGVNWGAPRGGNTPPTRAARIRLPIA